MRLARIIILILVLLLPLTSVQAARGIPGSPEFGYGAALNLDGSYINDALYMSSAASIDWVAIDVSWQSIEPEEGAYTGWAALDHAMENLSGPAALLRLVNPPAWSITGQGPSINATARIVNVIADRYNQSELAIELFPAANTFAGWGAAPDPTAYATLFQQVVAAIAPRPVYLAAGGLRPLPFGSSDGMDDLEFLQGLYSAGLKPVMPIVSLELIGLQGEPLTAPSGSDQFILRHYEQVRQVMVANDHANGSIWITRLQAPSDTIDLSITPAAAMQQQTNWRNQAALQIRSQLYIGMTVFQSLNPSASSPGLISASGEQHSFYPILQSLINQNSASTDNAKPGRPKDIALIKTKT